MCDEIGTVTQFLSDCPLFVRQRRDHIVGLLAHCTTKDLLFGEEALDNEENNANFYTFSHLSATQCASVIHLQYPCLPTQKLYN